MSLKDLLPDGTYDEIVREAKNNSCEKDSSVIKTRCTMCKKEIVYDINNPFRPFCSEKCRILDLGEWASNHRVIKGNSVLDDEDADLLDRADTPRYNQKEND